MNITFKQMDNTINIYLNGELDEYAAGYTRDTLDNIFESNKFNEVILDMTNLDFMDSTGIGVMIGRYKNLKSRNIDIYIANPKLSVEKILNMSGIFEIMPKIS